MSSGHGVKKKDDQVNDLDHKLFGKYTCPVCGFFSKKLYSCEKCEGLVCSECLINKSLCILCFK